MKRLCLALLVLLAAVPARAEDLVSGVSQDIIQITSNYTGTDIVVFGAIEGPQGRAGPRHRGGGARARRADDGAPARPRRRRLGQPRRRALRGPARLLLSRLHRALVAHRFARGAGALRHRADGAAAPPRWAAITIPSLSARRRIRYHKRVGLYTESPGSIDFLSETLFRTRVPVPAGVTRGQYNVEVYLFRDGQVVSAQSTPLFVDADRAGAAAVQPGA